jgi:hypothetical protein
MKIHYRNIKLNKVIINQLRIKVKWKIKYLIVKFQITLKISKIL